MRDKGFHFFNSNLFWGAVVSISKFRFRIRLKLHQLIPFSFTLQHRSRLQSTVHELDVRRQASTEKTLRMSRTFFIVIAVSLVFWLPAFVMFLIEEFCLCFSPLEVWFVIALQLGNSMVNPFVCGLRMPIFQDALKKCLRKRRQNNKLRPASRKSHNIECKL